MNVAQAMPWKRAAAGPVDEVTPGPQALVTTSSQSTTPGAAPSAKAPTQGMIWTEPQGSPMGQGRGGRALAVAGRATRATSEAATRAVRKVVRGMRTGEAPRGAWFLWPAPSDFTRNLDGRGLSPSAGWAGRCAR